MSLLELKAADFRADLAPVPDLSGNTWLLVAGAMGVCVLAVLHSLASQIRSQTNVHDLKMGVARLRLDYAERLRKHQEESGGEMIEAIPIEEFEAAQRQKRQDESLVGERRMAA